MTQEQQPCAAVPNAEPPSPSGHASPPSALGASSLDTLASAIQEQARQLAALSRSLALLSEAVHRMASNNAGLIEAWAAGSTEEDEPHFDLAGKPIRQ